MSNKEINFSLVSANNKFSKPGVEWMSELDSYYTELLYSDHQRELLKFMQGWLATSLHWQTAFNIDSFSFNELLRQTVLREGFKKLGYQMVPLIGMGDGCKGKPVIVMENFDLSKFDEESERGRLLRLPVAYIARMIEKRDSKVHFIQSGPGVELLWDECPVVEDGWMGPVPALQAIPNAYKAGEIQMRLLPKDGGKKISLWTNRACFRWPGQDALELEGTYLIDWI